jgi:hypothetical protein
MLVSGLAGLILSGSAMAVTMEVEQEFTDYGVVAESNAWQLINETLIRIPAGDSRSRDYFFEPLLRADEILVVLETEAGRPCRAGTTFIEMTSSEDQRIYSNVFANAEGVFPIASGAIHFLRFNNYHPGVLSVDCYRRLYARTLGDTPPDSDDDDDATDDEPSEEFEYLDFISYEGGFAQAGVGVENTAMLTKFWLRVPEYCAGLEVLEAGTVTEGVFDVAARVDADGAEIYEVNAGAGMRVSDIKATLNGPRDLSCDIPVYGIFAD